MTVTSWNVKIWKQKFRNSPKLSCIFPSSAMYNFVSIMALVYMLQPVKKWSAMWPPQNARGYSGVTVARTELKKLQASLGPNTTLYTNFTQNPRDEGVRRWSFCRGISLKPSVESNCIAMTWRTHLNLRWDSPFPLRFPSLSCSRIRSSWDQGYNYL